MAYVQLDFVDTPPDDTPLWRFLDLAKFCSLLQSRNLYFARLAELHRHDPFEAAYTAPSFRRVAKELRTIPDILRSWYCVCCWHESDHESAAMWRLYAGAGAGVAIRSTVGRVKLALPQEPEPEPWQPSHMGVNSCQVATVSPLLPKTPTVFIGRVQYRDYLTEDLPDDMVLTMALSKRKSFEYEREVRLITQDRIDARKNDPGIRMPCDLETLVQEVRVAPTSPSWHREIVVNLIASHGFSFPVLQSTLDDRPFDQKRRSRTGN